MFVYVYCHTLISSEDYHFLIFWFSLAELSCSTPITVLEERSFDVLVRSAKDTKMEGQRGLFRVFSGPQLAQASLWFAWVPKWLRVEVTSSPGRAKLLKGEATTRLGELQVHQVPSFSINKCEGSWGRGWTFSVKWNWREIREKKKKEEKNKVEALLNCDRNRLPHRSSFGVLRSSFG